MNQENKNDTLLIQVRIQDLCKGGPSEILPTSRSGVAAVEKIWASKLGVGGEAPCPPPLDPHLYTNIKITNRSIARFKTTQVGIAMQLVTKYSCTPVQCR